jgi:two-component system response regulator HydG
MERVYLLIRKVSQSSCPVLILGESGTGKELVARSIHFQSARKAKPFMPVDCAGLVPTLIESELFGHVRGAFTGATRTKPGLMELAGGGTLFLDEIGELPLDMQGKLLRALQEREVRPVGGRVSSPVDVRILAASNRNLEAGVKEGRFRRDLYYRLNVVKIQIPPLRERKNDVPHLVHYFLSEWEEGSRKVRAISEEAMAHMMRYDWPGNVRELENVVQRALALGSHSILSVSDLPSNLLQPVGENSATSQPAKGVVPLQELERRAILRAVKEVGGDKLLAARLLGIGKTTLYRKLKEYKLDVPE